MANFETISCQRAETNDSTPKIPKQRSNIKAATPSCICIYIYIYIYIYIIIRLLSSRDYIIIRFLSNSFMPLSRLALGAELLLRIPHLLAPSLPPPSFFFLNNCFSLAILQESSQETFKLTPPIEFHTGAAAPMVKRGQQQIKGALANQELVAACKQKT